MDRHAQPFCKVMRMRSYCTVRGIIGGGAVNVSWTSEGPTSCTSFLLLAVLFSFLVRWPLLGRYVFSEPTGTVYPWLFMPPAGTYYGVCQPSPWLLSSGKAFGVRSKREEEEKVRVNVCLSREVFVQWLWWCALNRILSLHSSQRSNLGVTSPISLAGPTEKVSVCVCWTGRMENEWRRD